jgi:hypothetical protein
MSPGPQRKIVKSSLDRGSRPPVDRPSNCQSRASINSGIPKPFTMSRGVRQGCPLSPTIFIIVLDGLLWYIDTIKSTVAVPFLRQVWCSILAYAYDMVILSDTPHGIMTIFNTCITFFNYYNMTLGVPKCAYTTNDNNKAQPNYQGRALPYINPWEHYK